MAKPVLIDTGPLVAILCREDAQHHSCVAALKGIQDELVTCWPVITEAVHLLGGRVDRIRSLLMMLAGGAVTCVDMPTAAAAWIDGFYHRFADQVPDLADAALMYLAERDEIDVIFSLDRRDFAVYRTSDNRSLSVIPVDPGSL